MIETFANGKVRSWASILDDQTREQAERTAELPIVSAPIALMPDAHLGAGAAIGTVLVTERAVIPMAVGVDVGCGMAARKLGLTSTTSTTSRRAAGWARAPRPCPPGSGSGMRAGPRARRDGSIGILRRPC